MASVQAALVRAAGGVVGVTQGVQAGPPERLVGVDVADAGQEGLIEQQRLEPCPTGPQAPPERSPG